MTVEERVTLKVVALTLIIIMTVEERVTLKVVALTLK